MADKRTLWQGHDERRCLAMRQRRNASSRLPSQAIASATRWGIRLDREHLPLPPLKQSGNKETARRQRVALAAAVILRWCLRFLLLPEAVGDDQLHSPQCE